jgi:transcriptional regulator with XRE-family HTH domain
MDAASRHGTLPEAIRALRKHHGSHERLAKALGTSRQRVIDWEKGAYPRDYVDGLIREGVPAELFESIDIGAVIRRLVELEQEARELRRALERSGHV